MKYLLLLVLLLLPGCDSEGFIIGVSLPLSGPAGFIGEAYLEGLLLAQEEINRNGGINGKEVVFYFEDNQNSAAEGVSSFRKLLTFSPDMIISTTSAASLAIAPLADEYDVPVFVSVSFADAVSSFENTASFFPVPDDDVSAILDVIEHNDIDSVGVLYLESEYARSIVDEFLVQTTADVVVESYLIDHSPAMHKVLAEDIDALYVVGVNVLPVIEDVRSISDIPVYTNIIPLMTGLVYEDVDVFEGVYMTALPVFFEESEFKTSYLEKHSIKRLGYASLAYDNMMSVAFAFENYDNLIEGFSSGDMFSGVNGEFILTRRTGIPLEPVVIKDGEVFLVGA